MQSEPGKEASGGSAERQLLDLATAHRFFASILEDVTGEPVPAPTECPQDTPASVATLRRWLKVLDLAISPSMLRDALTAPAQAPAAEALLRYFIHKCSLRAPDRDKADFVATFLYRIGNDTAGDSAKRGEQVSAFEREIAPQLPAPVAPLSQEHTHLLCEFEFFEAEVLDFRHFDQITDSGILQRVRAVKESFGVSFYHPRVLAVVAAYNCLFRRRFDELFRAAAAEIRKFASLMLREKSSIIVQISTETEVRQLTESEEAQILSQEYGRAQEQLRRVSDLRKLLRKQRVPQPEPARQMVPDPVEEEKIRKTEEMICGYLRAAGQRASFSVPLPHGNFRLTSPEQAAFRTEYSNEKSFRADFAALLKRQVALRARMTAELIEYSNKRREAYRWKPHADSLTYLLKAGESTLQKSAAVFALVEQRGLPNKREILEESLSALGLHMREVARALETVS